MAKVIVYSTTVCPWCVKVKEFLKQNNIEFEERNAQENQEYAHEVMTKTGAMAVPVIDIDGDIIIGYNLKRLKEALKLS